MTTKATEQATEEFVLERLATAMMCVELRRRAKTYEDALSVESETQRTFRRLLSSREAQDLMEELNIRGIKLVRK